MIVVQGGGLLQHFCVCVCVTHIVPWFGSFSIILPLPLLLFLKWLWHVSIFHIHTHIERTSAIFTRLYPLHFILIFPPFPSSPLLSPCFLTYRRLLCSQAGFQLLIFLAQPPKCWNHRLVSSYPLLLTLTLYTLLNSLNASPFFLVPYPQS
jgi:hypothetical protein